jgi:glutamyl-tRNA synthetase
MEKLMPLVHTRIKTFGEFMELCAFFFVNHLSLSEELLCPKGMPADHVCFILQGIIWSLESQENWGSSGIEKASHAVAEAFGVNHKKVVMPILYGAITGKRHGPPLFDSFELLGKDRVRARLLQAMEFLGGISNKKMSLLTKAWGQKEAKALIS